MSTDTRLWMYRAGEARLFEHPRHVPAGQGWQRFPVPGDGGETADCEPEAGPPEPGCGNRELSAREKLSRMSRNRLMQVASDCGLRIDPGCSRSKLRQAIIEVLNDNGP